MRKTLAQAWRSRIEPTSRQSDLVCLLFSRPQCDSASNLKQAYFAVILGQQTEIFGHHSLVVNLSKGNAPVEDWSDGP
jgi:hypothetical protein